MTALYVCAAAFFATIAGALLMALFSSGRIKELERLLAGARGRCSDWILKNAKTTEERDDARAECRFAMRVGLAECEMLREKCRMYAESERCLRRWLDNAHARTEQEAQRASDAESFLEGMSQSLENTEAENVKLQEAIERRERELSNSKEECSRWARIEAASDVEIQHLRATVTKLQAQARRKKKVA